MVNNCTICGEETNDNGDFHCRKILVSKVKQLLSSGQIEAAASLVSQSPLNEEWKKDMFRRFSKEPIAERERARLERIVEEQRIEEEKINSQLRPFFDQAESLIKNNKFREAEIYILKQQFEHPELCLWSKYKLGLRKEIPSEKQPIFSYTHRGDWQKFKDVLDRENINFFIHVTDRSNLNSIIRFGGLYSKQIIEQNNIYPKYISNELSRNLDRQKGIYDYIHLSIQKSPMMYAVEKNGIFDPVILKIDPRIIYAQETKFSDKNATDTGAKLGSSIEDFERIDFKVATSRWTNEDEKKSFQAEILVKENIPSEFILNL